MAEFERKIRFLPAYDLRSSEPGKNYGIGSMRMVFLLIGERGAVQWMISLPFFVKSARSAHYTGQEPGKPYAWDLGYHAKHAQYEDQEDRACDIIPEGRCFYDGSGLNALELVEGFVEHGDGYVWKALEAYYAHVFEDDPYPDFEAMRLDYVGKSTVK